MPVDHRTELAAIKRFDQLVRYLRDRMGWPIESEDFEEITFEYTPEELGIDPKNAAKIQEIKRLRPLSAAQPWGIFFVKFEPKRLPVVALRRILSQVALKKRASANSAERAAWSADDLLFVSNYGEGEERQISFAHFSSPAEGRDLPTLKVLGWDNRDTALHLDAVARELSENLAWPKNDKDAEAWRWQWRRAFTIGHRELITKSQELSIRLADLARAIRDRIGTALAIETEGGPLTRLMRAFQASLVHDMDAAGFADMYAQTIAYGLLSARIADPHKKTADDFAGHMRTNPFLRELMETFLKVGGRKGKAGGPGIDFDELGVGEVVALLDAANMEAVIRDFGDRNPQEDPVIHFYELFLHEYDAKKRVQRGVFYTPRPVVSYIVRSVDELLRTEFGLEDGLADTTTWAEITRRHESLAVPDGVSPDQDFVQILDPATGTGTFLVEVIDLIHRTLIAKWKTKGKNESEIEALWNEYVPAHLLTRLHGYELLMAPYAIAHLKVGLKLYETGYHFSSEERARIYLTNALEPARDSSGQIEFLVAALAHEAQAVNAIKQNRIFTAVIGNPPYSVSSWNTGAWITELVEDYKRTVREAESQIQSLSNDYIKFLRLGQWLVQRANAGVLGMITGHGYLQGTQPRDLRRSLITAFDRSYCLDLHGSVRRSAADAQTDEPVFQIMTGVAIYVGTRIGEPTSSMTLQRSLLGPLQEKFRFLSASTARSLEAAGTWHRPEAPNYHFASSVTAEDTALQYRRFVDLPECFGSGDRRADKEVYWATGFASQQDDLAMAFTLDELTMKMNALAQSTSFEQLAESYRLCTTDQWSYSDAKRFAKEGHWRQHVDQILYRPFDRRWTVLHKHVLTILRKRVMSQLGGSSRRLGLISSRAVNDVQFAHCFVADAPVDKIFLSSKTSTNAYVFPLYVLIDDLEGRRLRPNISRTLSGALGRVIGIVDRDEVTGLPKGVTAEDVLGYLYGILHSPSYRSRFGEFLKVDFPRIPLPGGGDLFRDLARLGGEMISTHLMDSSIFDSHGTEYVGPDNPEVATVGWTNDTVWLDARARRGRPVEAGSVGFRGVPEAVWNFHVGGYRVCEKWLKDRKGRTLTKDDVAHYQKIVVALSETIRLMKEIDEVIERHGGWPDAFASAGQVAAGETESAGRDLSADVVAVAVPHRAPVPLRVATGPVTTLLEAAEPVVAGYKPQLPAADQIDREELICQVRQLFSSGGGRSREAAIKELATALGYERVGPRIREELDNAIRTAVRRGILLGQGDELRRHCRAIEDYERDFLKEQFLASLQGRAWTDREEAIKGFARWLGFRRTGPSIDEMGRSLINGLIRDGRLDKDGPSIRRIG